MVDSPAVDLPLTPIPNQTFPPMHDDHTPPSAQFLASPASTPPHLPFHVSPQTPHLRRAVNDLASKRRKQKERKSRIQQTFLLISSASLVLLFCLICYYNFLMISPHLTALFWAVLWSLVLSKPQQWMLAGLRWMDGKLTGHYTEIILSLTLLTLSALTLSHSLLGLIVCTSVYGFFLLLLFCDRPHLVSLVLLLSVVLIIAFPLFFFLKTSVEETQEIVARTRKFINQNPHFELLLRDFTSSPLYHSALSRAENWGWERKSIEDALDLESIKARLGGIIGALGDQLTTVLSGALAVVAQLGSTILSLFSFLSFLYFLLDQRAAFTSSILLLSPFSEEENTRLGNEMRRSVQSIFACSFLIGLLHSVSTFVAFSLVGIDLCLILSFLAGFCSMLPLFSSWLLWLPAIVGMACMGRYVQAGLLLAIQVFLVFYLDPLVYGRIKPGNQSLIGMSIVFGLAAFGATGVILGPLLTTVSLTFCNIYLEYLATPLERGDKGKEESGGGLQHFFHPPVVDTPISGAALMKRGMGEKIAQIREAEEERKKEERKEGEIKVEGETKAAANDEGGMGGKKAARRVILMPTDRPINGRTQTAPPLLPPSSSSAPSASPPPPSPSPPPSVPSLAPRPPAPSVSSDDGDDVEYLRPVFIHESEDDDVPSSAADVEGKERLSVIVPRAAKGKRTEHL